MERDKVHSRMCLFLYHHHCILCVSCACVRVSNRAINQPANQPASRSTNQRNPVSSSPNGGVCSTLIIEFLDIVNVTISVYILLSSGRKATLRQSRDGEWPRRESRPICQSTNTLDLSSRRMIGRGILETHHPDRKEPTE